MFFGKVCVLFVKVCVFFVKVRVFSVKVCVLFVKVACSLLRHKNTHSTLHHIKLFVLYFGSVHFIEPVYVSQYSKH